jgi:hypothetical protein
MDITKLIEGYFTLSGLVSAYNRINPKSASEILPSK